MVKISNKKINVNVKKQCLSWTTEIPHYSDTCSIGALRRGNEGLELGALLGYFTRITSVLFLVIAVLIKNAFQLSAKVVLIKSSLQ